VSAIHSGSAAEIRLVLSNHGTGTVQLTLSDAYGNTRPQTFRLRPGARTEHVLELGHSHGWYDLTIVSAQDGGFLRRLAGHVETGRPSISDPAIGAS
jgi:phospholipase C